MCVVQLHTIYVVPLPPVNQGLVHKNSMRQIWRVCSARAVLATSANPEKEQVKGGGLCLFIFFRGGTQQHASAIAIACRSMTVICASEQSISWGPLPKASIVHIVYMRYSKMKAPKSANFEGGISCLEVCNVLHIILMGKNVYNVSVVKQNVCRPAPYLPIG